MSKKIIVSGSLIPSSNNAPLDIRTRINTIAEVESIQVPFVGMIFYVMDEEKFYVVKTLKGSMVGNIELKDSIVDTYEPLTADVDLTGMATKEFVEEQIAAIEHPQYDDSELRKLIDEQKPYLADVAAYPTSKFLFACGQPMTVEPNTGHKYSAEAAEDAVAFVYRWADGFECIIVDKAEAEKVYLVGGYGHECVGAKRAIPQTNMVVRNVKIKGLVGGNYFEGMVGHVNIEAENCEFVSVMGAGWCGASVNGQVTRMNVADDINVKMTNCKVTSTFFGGSQGNGVADDVHVELNNCEIGWLTAGGSNGMTRNAEIVLNGGSVKVAQSTNRGIVHKARFILNDGVVEKLYFGGETEDKSVNGMIEDGFVELNGGTVKQFNFGTNNGIEMVAEDVKGCIMNCVVENGDTSMLEIKVEEEEIEIDLSEYAKVAFVEEQIANIELKEGPEGPAGKDFTYDMFTPEQLEALRGPEGKPGKDADLSVLEGLATEEYVQDAIRNVQVGDEVDLSDFAKISYVDEQIANIEHPQYDDSELKERVEVLETINLETKPYIDKDGMLVLCGCPAVARGVGEEVHVVVRFFNGEEDKFIFTADEFAKTRICMGYGAEGIGTKRNIVENTLELYDLDRVGIIDGGSQVTGEVGTVNIIAERCNFIDGIQGARAMNGGERNIVHNFNVRVKDVKSIYTLYGGGNGYSVTWNSNILIEGETEIDYLIAGGSNGFTNKSRIVMNGGHAKIMQGVNRGILNRAELILNGGVVDNFYAAGDASDASVTGVQREAYVELNGGKVVKFFKGNSGSVEYTGEIKGHIMDCVVVEGDVSMLDVKVKDEEEIQIDLSDFAKISYVDEKIANIEHPRFDDSELRKDIDAILATQQRYVIGNVPEGTLVDYREKEIRVMCPEGTEFPIQQVGPGGDSNMYYMSLTSKAPDGAVKLIKSDGNQTETIDLAGKNSKVVIWLALADNGSYFGKTSSLDKYIGWTYTFKWLDENDKVIESDCFRINLSNENCHNAMQSYHGFRVAEKAYVDQQIAAIEHPQQDLSHLATKEEVAKLHEEKYVVKNVPEGTLVDFREKEIRIMVPADAEFVQQQVGPGGDSNMYYMSLTSKAPEGAVKLIESDGNQTETIDLAGKKAKTIWLALAMKQGAAWTYFGKNSNAEKYIGWTYSLKWLDENDKVIESDCFRINLSNENCHDDLFPYLGAPIASKAFVQEQIAAIEIPEVPEVNLEGMATEDFVKAEIAAIEHPQYDDSELRTMIENIELKEGPQGPAGAAFTYDMFTEEQLAALKGEDGKDGENGLNGENGKDGEQGPAGQDGISVTAVALENNHLMVTLSNGQVLDAGEMPAGSGAGGGMTAEERAELESLRQTKQQMLDMTYGVEYEWIYFDTQTSAGINVLSFDQKTAPGFYEDWLPVLESGDDALIEEFIMSVYEQDIYRMYVLRIATDPKYANRYLLVPVEDHSIQQLDPGVASFNPITTLTSWNWSGDEDGGFTINSRPTSPMVFAFLKVKEEYRMK